MQPDAQQLGQGLQPHAQQLGLELQEQPHAKQLGLEQRELVSGQQQAEALSVSSPRETRKQQLHQQTDGHTSCPEETSQQTDGHTSCPEESSQRTQVLAKQVVEYLYEVLTKYENMDPLLEKVKEQFDNFKASVITPQASSSCNILYSVEQLNKIIIERCKKNLESYSEMGHEVGTLMRNLGISMDKRNLGDLKKEYLKGKKVLVRVNLNVPLDDNLIIFDDTNVRVAVPTIKYLIECGAKVILCSHLRRPTGATSKSSLIFLVPKLSELLGVKVKMAKDCIGVEVKNLVDENPEGGVVLLENLRFHEQEKNNDLEFAEKLASLADLYVNDAFGSSHRGHASIVGVPKFLKPSVAGFHMQEELNYLLGAVANPKRPFAVIIGGSKVSSKIGVIESLLEKVDILLLGGGMIFTFYKAQGNSVGASLVEESKLDLAKVLVQKAQSKIWLPTDVVVADKFALGANNKVVPAADIPDGWMGLDIGPDSIKSLSKVLDSAQTVFWTGPMEVFKLKEFAGGTSSIAMKLAELSEKGVTTIVGGGETVAAVNKLGLANKMSHISTGGGASLDFVRGKLLPGVFALDDQ